MRWLGTIFGRIRSRCCSHCDQVLCMTDVEREQLERRGVPPAKLETIGSASTSNLSTGGDPERIRQRHKIAGPMVLHLGAKAFEKGSITLVEAMKVLWAQGSDAWLVMAGPEFVGVRRISCVAMRRALPRAGQLAGVCRRREARPAGGGDSGSATLAGGVSGISADGSVGKRQACSCGGHRGVTRAGGEKRRRRGGAVWR